MVSLFETVADESPYDSKNDYRNKEKSYAVEQFKNISLQQVSAGVRYSQIRLSELDTTLKVS